MSYILDALRKSDQQRQRGTAPITLAPEPVTSRPPVISSNLWLALVLLAAGIVIGWLRPWQQSVPTPAPAPVAVKPPVASPPPAALAPLPTVPQTVAKREPPTEPPAWTPPAGDTTADRIAPAPTKHAPETSPRVPATITPEPPNAGAQTEAAPEQKVVAMNELPPAIQQELPAIAISLHGYASKAGDRLVMINDKFLHQGDSIAAGLRLEEITPDGVILGYKGYRIRRAVR